MYKEWVAVVSDPSREASGNTANSPQKRGRISIVGGVGGIGRCLVHCILTFLEGQRSRGVLGGRKIPLRGPSTAYKRKALDHTHSKSGHRSLRPYNRLLDQNMAIHFFFPSCRNPGRSITPWWPASSCLAFLACLLRPAAGVAHSSALQDQLGPIRSSAIGSREWTSRLDGGRSLSELDVTLCVTVAPSSLDPRTRRCPINAIVLRSFLFWQPLRAQALSCPVRV